eukprot:CAMPEP_0185026590 /NCGR_PEP_ID=MMETSP1103-20130426/10944_1 /TAXON_ID=36769 /ORGANISM="Paraphysomonas bandaiensis, Strain Caron Lab Isolate" /LENGTH=734 /DNA_ID=CAMNT_0027560225 /DNA_START=58 /DNA_END=2263 /DNA_ORIENTATION=-
MLSDISKGSSLYDMGTYTLNFSARDHEKSKRGIGEIVWNYFETPLLLVSIGIASALLSYMLSFSADFSEINKDILARSEGVVIWALYSISNVSLACVSLYVTNFLCPESIGGGISDMKVILSGSIMQTKLSFRLLLAKLIGLSFALASGLSVGKEGPLVQMTSAIAEQLMRFPYFSNTYQNTSKRLEILACACAAGITATFGAAYGGVLYSIEVTCTTYMSRNLPRAYLSSIVGMLVFLALGATSHITLYTKVNDRSDYRRVHSTTVKINEMVSMILLGTICGIFGVLFVMLVKVVCKLRNRLLDKRLPSSILSSRKYLIVSIVALLITPVIYLEQGFGSTVKNIPLIDVVFRVQPVELTPRVLFYFPVKFLMTILCVTLPLPVGLFAPVFLLGGVLGRIVGQVMSDYPEWSGDIPAREFALIGAAAFSTGVTRAISTAVIVYELSGQPHLHLPLSVAILAAYFTSNRFSKNVYDILIECSDANYLPMLPKEFFNRPAADVMLPVDGRMVLDLNSTYRDAIQLTEELELLPEYASVLNIAVVCNKDDMVIIGIANAENMRSKIVDTGGKKRALTLEALDVSSEPTSQVRRFIRSVQTSGSFAYGESKENYFGHERIKFVMLKDKGASLMAVHTDELPGWKWQEIFSEESTDENKRASLDSIPDAVYSSTRSVGSQPSPRKVGRSSMETDSSRVAPYVRVDPSPYQVDETMHLNKVELLMRMLKLNEVMSPDPGN